MSKDHGHLADPGVQDALRQRDRRMDAIRMARWEKLLTCDWGRELVYELLFERGRLVALSLEPGIKDGVAMAVLTGRNEGVREFAATLLTDLQDAFGHEVWAAVAQVIAAREAERAARQRDAERSTTTSQDGEEP